jgi:hypothetical protein
MSHTKPIDLGHTLKDSLGEISAISSSDTLYPQLHIPDSDNKRLLDLGEAGSKGTAEIHYKVVNRTHREGDKRYTCSITLEITSIEPGHDPKFSKKKTHWETFH